jgi:predicted CXXCH cytochrome family protein
MRATESARSENARNLSRFFNESGYILKKCSEQAETSMRLTKLLSRDWRPKIAFADATQASFRNHFSSYDGENGYFVSYATLTAVATAVIIVLFASLMPVSARAQIGSAAKYVGIEVCADCHQMQAERWKKSHHALAMEKATPATVLGDFSGVSVEDFGVVSTFSRVGDKLIVRTDGPDGALHDYEIAYTFGIDPLQQYLIGFPDGRYQMLGLAWDTRPKAQGGQRWFHLYPDEKLQPGSLLHWTGRDQTWNYQCADCHTTDLKKNFNLATNTYATTWASLGVTCEACHGAGSRHVEWAKANSSPAPADKPSLSDKTRMGLEAWLKPTDSGRWEMNPATGTARRTEPLVSTQLDTCAPCHSRRKLLTNGLAPDVPFLDAALPALLEPGLYHADGQIDGEVFEYDSFLQSAMHKASVVCSNCHEPHSAKLRAEGNALCAQCHLPEKFDVTAHHKHAPHSAGAQCVNCHMPIKTYMVVHDRRDHSMRVPRPDLSVSIGTPNACNQCHTDRSAEWAAKAVTEWYPSGRRTTPHYGTALHAGRTDAVDAERQLDQLILDNSQPAIARASGLLLLPRYASKASETAIKSAIADPDPLVRMAMARGFPASAPRAIIEATLPLLGDPVRAVRTEAARALAWVDPQTMTPEQRSAFATAYQELIAGERIDADRPEAHLNLGLVKLRRKQFDETEAEYRIALRLDPKFVPAMANLADLDRERGMDQEGAELLRAAIAIEPNNAAIKHSLGLLLVRQRNYTEALPLFREAAGLAPDNARYAYVYAVALNSTGSVAEATAVLERTYKKHPADRDVLVTLIALERDTGDLAAALAHAQELARLEPRNPQIRALLEDLRKRLGR